LIRPRSRRPASIELSSWDQSQTCGNVHVFGVPLRPGSFPRGIPCWSCRPNNANQLGVMTVASQGLISRVVLVACPSSPGVQSTRDWLVMPADGRWRTERRCRPDDRAFPHDLPDGSDLRSNSRQHPPKIRALPELHRRSPASRGVSVRTRAWTGGSVW